MRYVLIALLLSGCTATNAVNEYLVRIHPPPPPGVTRAFVCPGAVFCEWVDMQPVGPTSQGDFTEPKRH